MGSGTQETNVNKKAYCVSIFRENIKKLCYGPMTVALRKPMFIKGLIREYL
jgi:hypothetical protein